MDLGRASVLPLATRPAEATRSVPWNAHPVNLVVFIDNHVYFMEEPSTFQTAGAAMPSSHLLFIPAVFMIGVLAGIVGTQHWAAGSSPRPTGSAATRPRGLAISIGVFMVVFLATHFAPIPGSVMSVRSSLNHQKLFDQSPTFSIEETHRRIEAFGPSGREAYQLFTFTTDLVFPLALFSFLFAFARHVGSRVPSARVGWSRTLLTIPPIAWLLMDLLENGTIYHMLRTHPAPQILPATLLPYLTISKYSLLALAFGLPIATFLRWLLRTKPGRIEAIA